MFNDHEPLTVGDRGLWNRGGLDSIPPEYLSECTNCEFNASSIQSRHGFTELVTVPVVKRQFIWKVSGQASRIIYLDGSGNIYDTNYPASPILSIPEMTDFSMATMFNRLYLTPHNGNKGLPGQFVYVYFGDGVYAIKAAGAGPTSGTLVATEKNETGKVEKGFHLLAVCFLTPSGFITAPGPPVFASITASGGKKIELSGVPIGPAGTLARMIIATRVIVDYNGNQDEWQYFFVPEGRLDDNTTEAIDLDFYDADLVSDATYTLYNLTEIPAGLGIGVYGSRMAVWASDHDESMVRVSSIGTPEAFNNIDGFMLVDPSENGPVRSCVEFRGAFYIRKSLRQYVTSDNLANAGNWNVQKLDVGDGSEAFCTANVLALPGQSLDKIITAMRTGLVIYDGSNLLPELSFVIRDLWRRINYAYFKSIQVYNDTIAQALYIIAPIDSAVEPSHLLYCDYSEGLAPDKVKWSIWEFPFKPTTICLDHNSNLTGKPFLLIGSSDGNIYKYDSSIYLDDGYAIDSYFTSAFLKSSDDLEVCHFNGIKVHGSGTGELRLTMFDMDDPTEIPLQTQTFPFRPAKPIHANVSTEHARLKCEAKYAGDTFNITDVKVFSTVEFESRPA